jgi:DNA (cytosine-5)-methyltransferase 1
MPKIVEKMEEPFIATARGREPQVLTAKRTEYGKQVRKQYESGELKASRHTMQQLEPRNDGVSNTLTSVEKDNYVCEPERHKFRIRKLTPRECFRLMGCDEPTIDKLLNAGISNSQLYKLAGNSIVVDVLTAIFDKMFVHTEQSKGDQLTLF